MIARLKHEFEDGEIFAMAGGAGGSKWQHYPLLPSLREYVLVSQTEPRVEIYRRLSSGNGEYLDVTGGEDTLNSGAVLDLASLYDTLPD